MLDYNIQTHVIIQARVGSTRLPGKILEPASLHPEETETMLSHLLSRLYHCEQVNRITVASPHTEENLPIRDQLLPSIHWYNGTHNENNLLSRYYHAHEDQDRVTNPDDIIVRITSDCPLHCPELIDQAILEFKAQDRHVSYASNTMYRTFIKGFDIELFTARALGHTYFGTRDPYDCEHCTPAIQRAALATKTAHRLKDRDATHEQRVHNGQLRATLDTPEDLIQLQEMILQLPHLFTYNDVLEYMNNQPTKETT